MTASAVLLSAFLALSCERPSPSTGLVFRAREVPVSNLPTRTRLDASDIETKMTGVTLAAYSGGALSASGHYQDGFDAMRLELDPVLEYTIYALVNMGDMTHALPAGETGMDALTYRIPSYTEGNDALNVRGLPMAGKLYYDGGSTVIPVQRLLARVTGLLSCEQEGAVIRSVRVCNLNRVLRPFAEGAAEEEGDILGEREFQEGTGTASGSFIFYVPENRQGTITGISSSEGKSPERNAEVNRLKQVLTYLETEVEVTGLYEGRIVYRSYLGSDAVSSFDILRNAGYHWNVRFLDDGQQESSWKKEVELTKTLILELSLEPAEASIVAGYTKTYAAYLTEIRFKDGVEIGRTKTRLAGNKLDWFSSDPAVASIAGGAVTAVAPGAVTITARLKSDPSVQATASLTVSAGTGGIDDGWDDGDEQILD